jgi:hypothetical protein
MTSKAMRELERKKKALEGTGPHKFYTKTKPDNFITTTTSGIQQTGNSVVDLQHECNCDLITYVNRLKSQMYDLRIQSDRHEWLIKQMITKWDAFFKAMMTVGELGP